MSTTSGTQTVVNFVVESGATLTTQPRVFDFEISTDAQTYYLTQMGNVQNILNQQPPTQGLTDADLISLSDSLNNLNTWSQLRYVSGGQQQQTTTHVVTDPVTHQVLPAFIPTNAPSLTISSTMDQYMAQQLDKLIRTLRSAGWDPIDNALGAAPSLSLLTQARDALQAIRDPATSAIYNMAAILTQALSAADQAHIVHDASTQSSSIQQVLMVDYVSTGNQILFNQLSLLNNAINVNQQALSYLNALQDLMNQKDPQTFFLQLNNLNESTRNTLSQANYDAYEKATFNQQLGTIQKFVDDGSLKTYLTNLTNSGQDPLAADILGAVPGMNSAYTDAITRIKDNLQYVIDQVTTANGSTNAAGGLIGALQTVKNDIGFLAPTIADWVKDTTDGKQGNFQNDLNSAVTSAQSFDDTSREQLRSVMFVYEEFYKSAGSLLSSLQQLLIKMADSIARG